MKALCLLLLAAPCLALGQADNPGWQNSFQPNPEAIAAFSAQPRRGTGPVSSRVVPANSLSEVEAAQSLSEAEMPLQPEELVGFGPLSVEGNEADEITPEIASLAKALKNDPVKIFEYVYNFIEYECYYGSKKGAHLTLLEGSGNDFDQAALLVALLRSAGHSPSYGFGPCAFSFNEFVSWWGISSTPYSHMTDAQFATYAGLTDTSPANVARERKFNAVSEYAYHAGFFFEEPYLAGGAEYLSIPFVWVEITLGGTTYKVSPAYKNHNLIAGIDLATASGYNRTQLLADAGGTTGSPDWVSGLNETAIGDRLTSYTQSILSALRASHDAKSVRQIVGSREIILQSFDNMAEIPAMFPDTEAAAWCPMEIWDAIPAAQMSKLVVKAGTYNYGTKAFTGALLYNQEITMPSLKGRKLSLSFSGNTGRIHLDEDLLGSTFLISAAEVDLQLEAKHNHFTLTQQNDGSYTASELTRHNQSHAAKYKKADTNAYAFVYSFANPAKHLRNRQERLDAYKRAGLPSTDWRIISEGLNVMGLAYFQQCYDLDQAAGNLYSLRPVNHHRMARSSQEGSFFIDVGLQLSNLANRDINYEVTSNYGGLSTLFQSAMEHGILEQTQGSGQIAASTVRMIQKSNALGDRIYRATKANWSSVKGSLLNYTSSKPVIEALLATSTDKVLLPQNGEMTINDWTGGGYAFEGTGKVLMVISKDLNGGYGTNNIDFFAIDSYILMNRAMPGYELTGSSYFDVGQTPLTTAMQYSWDPVEMASGAYVLDKTDLVLGGAAPLGLTLSRHYHSNRRHDDSAGLGYGWARNSNIFITERSAPDAALGAVNGYQMAPFLAALVAAKDLHTNHANAKQWATAALVIHWSLEQMRYKAVSVTMGNRSIQFVQMPDGTFVPPPGMNLTLAKNGLGNYVLSERHGSVMTFDAAQRISTLANPNGATQTFGYDGSGRLATVTDAYGRVLTFTWSDGHISSVTDGTDRSVSYGYTTGDLTSFTDPEGKVWTYQYDAEHRMTGLKDPDGRTLAANDFDSDSRVIRQRSMGDAQREWTYLYSGFLNTEINPQGGATRYFHDERGRSIGVSDPSSNTTLFEYDGQDRKTLDSTPEYEDSRWTYNADNNVVTATDPKNQVTQFFYDVQKRLQRVRDKRGKDTTYTYTAQHQVATITDPLNHTVTNTYHPDGTLHTVTDGENKAITHTYDAWGQVNKTTFDDDKFVQFTNNARGDILTSTDPLGRVTTRTYNKRRQLLTTNLPSVPDEAVAVVTNTYDNSGNLQSTTDANQNVTSHTYNALGKVLTTTEPALPAGSNVITRAYDTRDWLVGSTNSANQTVTFELDATGRTAAILDPLNRRTESTFDRNGRVKTIKDPLNRITRQNWNQRGEQTSVSDGLNYVNYLYDANGNQTRLTNRRQKAFNSIFDDANRLTSMTSPGGKVTAHTYYNNNLPKTVVEPSGQTATLTYNARNQIATKSDPLGTVTYSYNDNGNLTTVSDSSGVLTRTWDERGRLKSFTNADGDIIGYKYDPNGNLIRLIYPDNKQVHYSYNARNQLATVTDWDNRITTYSYDGLGHLVGIQRPNGTTLTIGRDHVGQVLSLREGTDGKLFHYQQFGYDAAGQVTSSFHAPVAQEPVQQLPAVNATHDDDNRLASFSDTSVFYDADGNMISGPIQPWSGATSLNFNSRNQLTSANGVSYTYDSEGRRRTMEVGSDTTRYAIDPSASLSRLLVKHNPDDTKTYYVHGIGLLYEVDEAGATKTYHYDQVGSTLARTNDTGSVVGTAEYSPYGSILVQTGDMDTPFLFNGEQGVMTDGNGLLHMRARFYSPYLMRFVNPDPSGFSGGLNWFAYANGNPISLNDPFGLSPAQNPPAQDDLWGQIKYAFNGLLDSASSAMFDPQGAMISGVDKTIAGAFAPAHGLLGPVEPFKEMGAYQEGSFADKGGDFMAAYIAAASGYLGGRLGDVPVGYNPETAGMTMVSRWGRSGLQAGDFVMEGEASFGKYFWSGKWQPGMGNQYAPLSAGEEFLVPSGFLTAPSEAATAGFFDKGPFGWVKDQLGQRTFLPNK